MDFNQLELDRQTMFKDAVLSEAEAKSMAIITAAHAEGEEELRKARLLCEEADEASITARLAQAVEKEYSTVAQNTRRQLLLHRAQLVDGLFAEIEKDLADFAGGKGYLPWMKKKLLGYATFAKEHKNVTIFLRPADSKNAAALEKALPGVTVRQLEEIRLGGFRIQGGNQLYDETLDEALAEEKQRFFLESGLRL